jgi:aspartate aminotransferase
LNDATPVLLPTLEEEGYALLKARLESVLTPRSKAVILNSPCNPTGAMYDRATLEVIADVACRHNLLIVSDEIYEKICYDGRKHVSIASLSPEVAARTVVINGVSKAYAMTGWRIGYAAGPKDLLTAMANIQSQSTSNPTSISQKAAVAAINSGDDFPRRMVVEFDRRRRKIVERLNTMPGVRCSLPAGAFYAFPNVAGVLGRCGPHGPISTPADLATYLLNEAKIAVVPGEPFGSTAHIRLSYATSDTAIATGMDRMEAALRKLA